MLTEAEKRAHRACFTGHRPEKITVPEKIVKAALEREVRQAVSDGINVFISGMARGVDLWAAEIVLRLRDEGLGVRLICASPFEGFESSWNETSRHKYRSILGDADYVRFISPRYSKACFQIRNEWMVNHSARVIAVFNGMPSGTKNTIDYANSMDIPVNIIYCR